MSIESNIQELTEAVKALTAAIVASQGSAPPAVKPKTEKKPASASPTTAGAGEKSASKPEGAVAPHGATPPSTEGTAAPVAGRSIPFKQLADVAIKLNTKNYAALKAICEREGIAKISGLPEDKWAAIHDEIVGLLGE